jgi:RNA polymerase sigma factor for flagellar operon FliA
MNALPVRLTIDQAWDKWHAQKDPLAREWLVVHYASLVKFVAGRLAAGLPKRVEIGDLVSSGVFGLMNAIDRFDPALGFKFETYAIPRIRGAILDSLRSLDWVPRSVRSKARTVENAISDLEHELKRPLDHVVADNTAASTHGGASYVPSPDSVVEASELRKIMRSEIKRLPERERTVLVLYYEENLTLGEIGDVLGVTESRVSQIHTKAVLQLRSRLAAADVA